MTISRSGFEVIPDMKINPLNAIPVFQDIPPAVRFARRGARTVDSRHERTGIV